MNPLEATSATTLTEEETKASTELASAWNILVFDDPVNSMEYVTKVLQKVFAYPREQAEDLMLTIHTAGKALVWTGAREPAELYVQQLHGFQRKPVSRKPVHDEGRPYGGRRPSHRSRNRYGLARAGADCA